MGETGPSAIRSQAVAYGQETVTPIAGGGAIKTTGWCSGDLPVTGTISDGSGPPVGELIRSHIASGDAGHVRWPRPTRIKNQPLPTQYSRSIGSLTKENLDAREDAIACGRAQRVRVCTEAGEPIGLMGMGELSGRGALHFLVISWLAMFCDLTIGVDLLRQRNALAEIIGARLRGVQGHSFSRRSTLLDTTVH